MNVNVVVIYLHAWIFIHLHYEKVFGRVSVFLYSNPTDDGIKKKICILITYNKLLSQ